MPIIEATESLPSRPPIILLYGDPGVSKTSLFNTSEAPLLIDFDRGVQRSVLRKSTLVVNSWEEVQAEEAAGTFRKYKTIGIDTAKACLDDFLMDYVCRMDSKLRKNKLHAYGAIGDEFKLFVNQRRNEQVAIVIIAHAKKDEDKSRYIPDITGQSYALLMRVADQVGFVSIENGQRVINWEPTEYTVGKNVARMPKTIIPDMNDAAFRDFNAILIEKVRASITALTEEQEAAMAITDDLQLKLEGIETPAELTALLETVQQQPEYIKIPLKHAINGKMKAKGWNWNVETKCFEVPAADQQPTTGAAGAAGTIPEDDDRGGEHFSHDLSPEQIIEEFHHCGDIHTVAMLYHANTHTIETTPELKALFDSASAHFDDDHHQQAPAAPQQPSQPVNPASQPAGLNGKKKPENGTPAPEAAAQGCRVKPSSSPAPSQFQPAHA